MLFGVGLILILFMLHWPIKVDLTMLRQWIMKHISKLKHNQKSNNDLSNYCWWLVFTVYLIILTYIKKKMFSSSGYVVRPTIDWVDDKTNKWYNQNHRSKFKCVLYTQLIVLIKLNVFDQWNSQLLILVPWIFDGIFITVCLLQVILINTPLLLLDLSDQGI